MGRRGSKELKNQKQPRKRVKKEAVLTVIDSAQVPPH